MKRILHDGALVYEPHEYKNEMELQEYARQHVKTIFGEDAIWLPGGRIGAKPRDRGAKGIPDAFVILPSKLKWIVVEVELARHDLHRHINPQISRFAVAWKRERKALVDQLTKKCKSSKAIVAELESYGYTDIHEFLSDLLEDKPDLSIIIDGENEELSELEDIWNFNIYWSVFSTFNVVDSKSSGRIHQIDRIHDNVSSKGASTRRRRAPPREPRSLHFLGKIAAYRYSKHIPVMVAEELIKLGKFPKKPFGLGGDRYIVNRTPKHPKGNDFFQPVRLSNGWWIETHASEERNRYLAEKLIEHSGEKNAKVQLGPALPEVPRDVVFST